jgi:hypothetical protein
LEGDRPDREQETSRTQQILQRRERLRAQLVCPACGAGRMPDTEYCVRCGAKLPEVRREESAEAAELKRPGSRAFNWVVDLVPGVISPKVLLSSLLVCAGGIAGGWYAASMLTRIETIRGLSGLAAIASLGPYALVAFASVVAYVSGVTWMLYGKVCSPFEAFDDFRVKHWLLFLALVVSAARVVLWLA